VAALKNLLRVAMWDECQIALEAMGRRAARAAPRRPAPPLPLPRFPLPSDFTSGACEARAREPLPPRAARRRRGARGPPGAAPGRGRAGGGGGGGEGRPLVSLVTKGGLANQTPLPTVAPTRVPTIHSLTHSLAGR